MDLDDGGSTDLDIKPDFSPENLNQHERSSGR